MKRSYRFGLGQTEKLPDDLKIVLGGKGAGLQRLAQLGLPIPPGVTITTDMYSKYVEEREVSPQAAMKFCLDLVEKEVLPNLPAIDAAVGRHALFSVRSGARVSMPGMMETVLNVGMSRDQMELFEKELGEWCAWDSYRRLLQMFATVVLSAPDVLFEEVLTNARQHDEVEFDSQLSIETLKKVCLQYDGLYEAAGAELPKDLNVQLAMCVKAVFESWDGQRAREYRRVHGYPDDWGTAVNVQAMVFGNRNDQSASGVAFTRDPSTGSRTFVGEYLRQAQGEDVVSGVRTPEAIGELGNWLPMALDSLLAYADQLEEAYRDMLDLEFTIEDGKLWMLQVRNGKRTDQAALKIATDLFAEDKISEGELLKRLPVRMFSRGTAIAPVAQIWQEPDAKGLAAGGGWVCGNVAFDIAMAKHMKAQGKSVIYVRENTTPDDIEGLLLCDGVLTSKGGMTSHAAVVARGLNKPCIVGCSALYVSDEGVSLNGQEMVAGSWVTMNADTGEIWEIQCKMEAVNVVPAKIRSMVATALSRVDGVVFELTDYASWDDLECQWQDMTFVLDLLSVLEDLEKDVEPAVSIVTRLLTAGATVILYASVEGSILTQEITLFWLMGADSYLEGRVQQIAQEVAEGVGKNCGDLSRLYVTGVVLVKAKTLNVLESLDDLLDTEGTYMGMSSGLAKVVSKETLARLVKALNVKAKLVQIESARSVAGWLYAIED